METWLEARDSDDDNDQLAVGGVPTKPLIIFITKCIHFALILWIINRQLLGYCV